MSDRQSAGERRAIARRLREERKARRAGELVSATPRRSWAERQDWTAGEGYATPPARSYPVTARDREFDQLARALAKRAELARELARNGMVGSRPARRWNLYGPRVDHAPAESGTHDMVPGTWAMMTREVGPDDIHAMVVETPGHNDVAGWLARLNDLVRRGWSHEMALAQITSEIER